MQVLDAMQVSQRKGKAFSLFGCDEFIDVDRVNRLLTFPVATTVAKGLPTSGETGKKAVSHHCYLLVRRMPASTCINQGQMQRRTPRRCIAHHDRWALAAGTDCADRYPQRPSVVLLVDLIQVWQGGMLHQRCGVSTGQRCLHASQHLGFFGHAVPLELRA
jgi:hypothetical protein